MRTSKNAIVDDESLLDPVCVTGGIVGAAEPRSAMLTEHHADEFGFDDEGICDTRTSPP